MSLVLFLPNCFYLFTFIFLCDKMFLRCFLMVFLAYVFAFLRYEDTWAALHRRAKECASAGEVKNWLLLYLRGEYTLAVLNAYF